MITTRMAGNGSPMFRAEISADPRFRAGYGLGAGRMSYGDGLGEAIRWAPLGPGGEPQMSLQGRRRGLGEVIRWAPLGPGGDPQMSLQGLGAYGDTVNLGLIPTTMAEVDWYQLGLGAVLGIGIFMVAKKQKWIR